MLLVVVVVALLALAAPAAAQVGLADYPRADSVALAGPEVVVARTGEDGSIAVDAVPRGGGPARPLFRLPSRERYFSARASLSASPQRVALLVELEPHFEPQEWRLYAGPPAGPLTLELRSVATTPGVRIPYDLAVDGDRALIAELHWESRTSRARVFAPGAEPAVVPWPGNVFGNTAIAGDLAAFMGSERRGRNAPVDRIFVVDWRTGAVATSVHVGDPDDVRGPDVDLTAGGSVVVADDGRLVTAAPGVPQRPIPHRGRLSSPRFAGAAGIAALRGERFDSDRPVAVAPGGGATRPIGDRSTALRSLVADEHGAAWIANGCVRYAPLDGSPAPATPDPCPRAELFLEEHDQELRGRTLRVLVTCVAAPRGCRGTAVLGRRGRLGRGRFDVPAGTRRMVALRLTRRGMRFVARGLRRNRDPLGLGGVGMRLGARTPDGRIPSGYRGKGVLITGRR
jgi:hypothetical protein